MNEKISVFVICVEAIIYYFYIIYMNVPLKITCKEIYCYFVLE